MVTDALLAASKQEAWGDRHQAVAALDTYRGPKRKRNSVEFPRGCSLGCGWEHPWPAPAGMSLSPGKSPAGGEGRGVPCSMKHKAARK